MLRITITSKKGSNLYGQLVKKEVELARANKGTLFRSGKKQKGYEKWAHVKYPGWVWFQKCMGDVVIALVNSKAHQGEYDLAQSFIAFVDRHFREDLVDISMNYSLKDE